MAITEKEVKLVGSKGEHELVGLFGSGAAYSCIDGDLAKKIGTLRHSPEPHALLMRKSGKGQGNEQKQKTHSEYLSECGDSAFHGGKLDADPTRRADGSWRFAVDL